MPKLLERLRASINKEMAGSNKNLDPAYQKACNEINLLLKNIKQPPEPFTFKEGSEAYPSIVRKLSKNSQITLEARDEEKDCELQISTAGSREPLRFIYTEQFPKLTTADIKTVFVIEKAVNQLTSVKKFLSWYVGF